MRSRSVACVAIVAAIASTSTTGCRKKHRPEPMTRVWLGKNGAFGLLKKGGLASWGEGTQGLLGDGTTTSRALPKLAFTDNLPHELAVGDAHACGIFDGDRVTCWGAGNRGQRGDGGVRASVVTSPKDAAYVTLADGSPLLATRVVARADRTCAVAKGTNALFCWGAGRATPFELPVFRGASADLVALSDEDVARR